MNNVSALLLSFACAALLSLRLLGLAVPHLRCRFFVLLIRPFAEPLAIGAVCAVGPFLRWCCPGRARVALSYPRAPPGSAGVRWFSWVCSAAAPLRVAGAGRPSVSLFQASAFVSASVFNQTAGISRPSDVSASTGYGTIRLLRMTLLWPFQTTSVRLE
jgi:hypothetical protein